MKTFKHLFITLVLLTVFANVGWGQISITSLPQTYSQNFDVLGTTAIVTFTNNTTLTGWYITTTKLPINTGSTNANSCYNFGVLGTNALTDRSLGAISTSTSHRFGLRIANNSGTSITSFNISFTGEQWRAYTSGTLTFDYQTGSTVTSLTTGTWTTFNSLDFASLSTHATGAATDGNNSSYRTSKSATLTVTVPTGTEILFRWNRVGSSSPGLGIDDLSITANGTPTISVGSITDFGNQVVNTTSNEKSYNVSGNSLTTNISIIPPSGYEISTGTGGSFVATNPITLTATNGTVASTPIYVRFVPTAVQSYSGNITHTSGAVTQNVAVTGAGTYAASPTTQTSAINFSNVTQNTFDIAWTSGNGNNRAIFMKEGSGNITNPSNGTTYTASNNWVSKGTQLGSSGYYCIYNGNGSTVSMSGLSAGLTYYVQAFEYNGSGISISYYTVTASGNPNNQTTTASSTPTISVGSLTGFGNQTVNTISGEQSYSVSGTALADNISIAPPAGFEISTGSGVMFVATNPIVLSPSGGTVAPTNIYVRFKPTAITTYTGDISHTSTGATTQNVAVTGTGVAPTDPTVVTATAMSNSQINIAFTKNGSNNVIVAWNTTNSFGTPVNGNGYSVGNTITGGGTILYVGGTSPFNHTLLTGNTAYYYKVWTVDASNFYSSGITTNATTYQDAPTTQASLLTFSNVSFTSMTVAWTNGNGYKRIVKINTTNNFTDPTGTDPTANTVFGGTEQVIFNGTASTVSVTGLSTATTYWFCVYEYNNTGTYTRYNISSSTDNPKSQITLTASAPIISSPTITGRTSTSATLGGNITNDGGSLITERGTVWSTTSPVTINDNKLAEGNTTTGVFTHSRTSLPVGTLLYFAAYATNSIGTTLTTESSFYTYASQPTTQASSISFSNTGMTSMTVSWTNGNGANRIVVVKASGTPNAPTNGITYTANTVFGSGGTIGTGEYVVYNGTGNTVDITGLTGSTTYTFKVFEYNGSAGTENYLTSSNATSQATTGLMYYSTGSVDPTVTTNWKTNRDGTGTSPTNFTSGEKFVIQNGHSMTTSAVWSISGTNSKLWIENGGTLTSTSAITLSAATAFQIDNGGTYIHSNATAASSSIFGGTESFASNSNVRIDNWSGNTAVLTTGVTLPFGNLEINWTTNTNNWQNSWSGTINLCSGNFKLTSVGTGSFRYTASSAPTVNIAGNYTQESGTVNLASSSGATVTTLNIGGNFTINGGTITSTSSGSKLVFNGSSLQTVSYSTGTISVPNYELNNASGLTLNSSITLPGTLTISNGRILVGANTFTVNTLSISSPDITKMIVLHDGTNHGSLALKTASNTSYLFPIGGVKNTDAATNYEYSPTTLTLVTGATASTYITAQMQGSKHSGNSSTGTYLDRFWSFSQTGMSSFSYTAAFTWLQSDFHGGNEADLTFGKYSGGIWNPISGSISNHTFTGTTVLTSFSDFTGGEQGAMPVTLSSFASNVNKRNIKLLWTTASEINNAGFEIERREQGKGDRVQGTGTNGNDNYGSWGKVGFVKGKGTTSSISRYEFNDLKLNTGKYNYRLKQIDYNGNYEYFVLNNEVEVGVPDKFNISQNYPNPFNPVTKIDFDLPFDSKVNISLYDITGREVRSLINEQRTAGYHTIQFNASDLSSGIYFYRIITKSSAKDFVMTKKMAVVK